METGRIRLSIGTALYLPYKAFLVGRVREDIPPHDEVPYRPK
jgi:hypothetical protein